MDPGAPVAITPGRIGTAGAIALGLFLVFNGNLRAINSIDTRVIQHTAFALAATGRADLAPFPELIGSGVADGYVQIVNGRAYSSYPLLPALLAAPAYRAAMAVGLIDPHNVHPGLIEAIGAIVASGLVALACAVLYLTIGHWRPAAPAALIAGACGLATPLWSSASQALWSHAPAAFFLAFGLGAALAIDPDDKRRGLALFACGVSLALAVFCRQLLAVFPLGLAAGLWRTRQPRLHLAMLLAGVATGTAVMMTANLIWLGAPAGGFVQLYGTGVSMRTHGVSGPWAGRWMEGLAGILVSPSRGLLVYMPVALLAVAGSRAAWRNPMLRYTLVIPVILFIALWAKYAVWWGGHSFGPRLAADIAIPLALLAACAVVTKPSAGRLLRLAAVVIVVWSVSVQAVGAFCYPAGDWNGSPRNVDLAHERLWDWRDSQIVRTMSSGSYQHYRTRQDQPQPAE